MAGWNGAPAIFLNRLNSLLKKRTIDYEMRRQQLELVYQSTRSNQVLSPIAGVLLTTVLWPAVDHGLLIGWLSILCALSFSRHLLARNRITAPSDPAEAERWQRQFMVSLALASGTWGMGGWILIPEGNVAYEALIYCFVLGMAGGTAALYSAHGPSVALAISLILAPSTAHMFFQGDMYHLSLGLGGVMFVLGTTRATRLLNRALRRNIELAKELDHLARSDALSGLNNRRGFTEIATPAVINARRSGRDCVLIMLDIDDFKVINDQLGHATGDAVIAAFGQMLTHNVREGEPVGRIGGEEFAVLLPDSNVEEAILFAERLLEEVRTLELEVAGCQVAVTTSIGISHLNRQSANLETLLKKADEALYRAKRDGKDRVSVAESYSSLSSFRKRISPRRATSSFSSVTGSK